MRKEPRRLQTTERVLPATGPAMPDFQRNITPLFSCYCWCRDTTSWFWRLHPVPPLGMVLRPNASTAHVLDIWLQPALHNGF